MEASLLSSNYGLYKKAKCLHPRSPVPLESWDASDPYAHEPAVMLRYSERPIAFILEPFESC